MPTDELIHGLTAVELQALTAKCLEARERAYCPYSLFRVGASLLIRSPSSSLSSPTIITGANVENAAYPVGTCAERVAMGTAVVQGYQYGDVKAVGVATDLKESCSPCGMCRQFLREFLEPSTPIFMHDRDGNYDVMTMEQLLPMSFGPDKLPKRDTMAAMREEGK